MSFNYTNMIEAARAMNNTAINNSNHTWNRVVNNVEIMSPLGWIIIIGGLIFLGTLLLFLKD